MVDRILFIIATLFFAVLFLLILLDLPVLLNVLLKIMAISGFIIAIYDFITHNKKK